jgi:hypothetical protein
MHIAGLSIMPASWAPQQKKSSWLVSYSNEGEGDTTDLRLPFTWSVFELRTSQVQVRHVIIVMHVFCSLLERRMINFSIIEFISLCH